MYHRSGEIKEVDKLIENSKRKQCIHWTGPTIAASRRRGRGRRRGRLLGRGLQYRGRWRHLWRQGSRRREGDGGRRRRRRGRGRGSSGMVHGSDRGERASHVARTKGRQAQLHQWIFKTAGETENHRHKQDAELTNAKRKKEKTHGRHKYI